MKPVLTIFFDALKPESLIHMPFLNSLAEKRRMRGEFGYSVACHPSMYSGVHTDKHLQWFVWKHAPDTSPFGWARIFKYLGLLDTLPSRYFLHKYTGLFREKNSAWFGVPLLVNLPLRYWPLFDVVEKRSWEEPGYLTQYPTIFDILRQRRVAFELLGLDQSSDEFAQFAVHQFTEIRPWTYLFLGSIDSYSHRFRHDGPQTIERMRRLDELVADKVAQYARLAPDFDLLVFSDHGHIPVERQVDIHAHFRRHGANIHSYVNMVEANFARFWFRSERERAAVEKILAELDGGFILDAERMAQNHVGMPDKRYGDLIFYLDRGAIFSKTIWGFSRTQKSMHGYLPEYSQSDGVLLSNRPLAAGTHAALVDVLPTLLTGLGLPVPEYVDGRSLWSAPAGAQGQA